MRHAAVILLLAAPALAQEPPPYLDDRSTPEALVESLYNAVNRHEYLRAWSYFRDGAAPPYEAFRDGYANTASVELRRGEVTTEGAAGSLHSTLPVAIRAVATDGTATVFVGCYQIIQVQPGIQEAPPFRPIQIEGGRLEPTDEPLDQAMGTCD